MAWLAAAPRTAVALEDPGSSVPHEHGELEQASGVVSPFFNESGGCDDAAGVVTPASTTNSLPNRALPSGHQVRGSWGDFFGRDYGDVSSSQVWWTVPMSGGKQVKVHTRALPAFQQVTANLAAEQANGRYYNARIVGSWVWRRVGGSYRMSTHAFGATIDINWDTNPFDEDGDLTTDMPNWYVNAWRDAGFCWGGDWQTAKDPMHFSWKGPIATDGYGTVPAPYQPVTAKGDFTDGALSVVAEFSDGSEGAEYHWADGTRDGVADLYRLRPWVAGSTLVEVSQARHDFRWCSIRSHVVPGAPIGSVDDAGMADVDGDSRPDLVLADDKNGNTRVRAWTYESGYDSKLTYNTNLTFAPGREYLFGDHDRDGLPDLHVVTPGSDTSIRVFSASSGHTSQIASRTLPPNTASGDWQFALGDVDVDGVPDLVFIDVGTEVELRFFDGASDFDPPSERFTTAAAAASDIDYGITDWDGDGRPDLIYHKPNHRIRVFLGGDQPNDADFWFKPPDLTCSGSGSSIHSDFNGDRHSDLAVGIPGETISGIQGVGAAAVIYSTASGPDATFGDDLWPASTADEDEGSGVSEFGTAVASGDFNGDGFEDLAVGSPGDTVKSKSNSGSVTVVYGTVDGADEANAQRWDQSTDGVKGKPRVSDRFGAALAAGDFNDDGYVDLAVGAPGEDVAGRNKAGRVQIFYGTRTGLSAKGDQIWSQATAGVRGRASTGDRFGSALATGDFDGDGIDDLAIGVPFNTHGAKDNVGKVNVLYGTSNGLSAAGDDLWSLASDGVPGATSAGDHFGWSLASGDFDGDLYTDLAIGIPDKNTSAGADVGKVTVVQGSSAGLTGAHAELWSQNSPGVKGSSEASDRFGASVVSADFDGDGRYELAIGAPGEMVAGVAEGGKVNLLYGTSAGLSATGDQVWSEASPGVPGSAEAGDGFGDGLDWGDFNGDGYHDLVVGVPGEDVAGAGDAGKVVVLFGSAGGLVGNGSLGIHQASPGVKDAPDTADRFGHHP